jgi:aminobenzoyl-glutamate transport protein
VTNEALGLIPGAAPITILANYWFSVVCSVVLAIVAALVTERIIEPRLGVYQGPTGSKAGAAPDIDKAAEGRGLRWALFALLGFLAVILVLTVPEGSALRDPETGDIIGTTPFMDSLLFIIAMFFLVSGVGFGYGAGTFKSANDVIAAVTKTFAGLAGLVFMLLVIAQFIAFFNYSNMPDVLGIALAEFLETSGIGALPLLIGMILIILVLDLIMPGLVPKWAIFAPILVPLFVQLGVPAQTLLAAYRVGDSPLNVVTPLMVYLPFIVTIAQRYDPKAGIGTVIALMIPYVIAITLVWIFIFIVWFVLGLPLGPGYPITI